MNYKLGEKVKGLIENSDISSGEKQYILTNKRITYDELKKVIEKSKTEHNIMYYMSDMVPIFEVYDTMEEKKKPKTAEYEKLMKRLRIEEHEKEYRRFLKKDDGSYCSGVDAIGKYAFLPEGDVDINKVDSIGGSAKEVKHQLTTIFNILITVVSVGYAVWYWSGSSMGLGNNDAIRLLLSLFASILVLVAEVVVFGGYLRKVEEAKGRERKMVENKHVVSTVVFGQKKTKGGKLGRNRNAESKMSAKDGKM